MITQTQLDLATSLLMHERRGASDDRAAASRVFDKMFAELIPIVGDRGVVAVFARSAVAAKSRCAALRGLVMTIDSVEAVGATIRDHLATVEDPAVVECAVTLCAAFVSLMSRLIGFPLTVQLLQRAWPEVDLKESP